MAQPSPNEKGMERIMAWQGIVKDGMDGENEEAKYQMWESDIILWLFPFYCYLLLYFCIFYFSFVVVGMDWFSCFAFKYMP